ncbi:MAG: hypothetical protein HOV79_21140 [Hamadaea sp.]|nr:hypothetical protein [Hamadaea sp.]
MRLPVTAAVLLAGLALAAGCQKSPEPSTAASANTTVGDQPSASAAASPSAAPQPSTAACGRSGTASGGSGPALALRKAWLACDTGELRKLTTDAAYAQLTKIGNPKIDMTWTLAGCDGAAGSTYCTYRNKLGSDVIVRVRTEPGDHPVSEVRLDTTIYHADAEKYAREFLDAFVAHNKPRMVALSSQAVVDSIVVDAPPAGYTLTLTPEPKWVYSAQFTSTGEYWIVTIRNPLGKAHAITAFGNAG